MKLLQRTGGRKALFVKKLRVYKYRGERPRGLHSNGGVYGGGGGGGGDSEIAQGLGTKSDFLWVLKFIWHYKLNPRYPPKTERRTHNCFNKPVYCT